MDIAYVHSSKFLPKCEEAIITNTGSLSEGCPLFIKFDPKGYNGEILVNIEQYKTDTFETNWESNDPTRFPARIKAAATALRNEKCFGKFKVSHYDGLITIKKLVV